MLPEEVSDILPTERKHELQNVEMLRPSVTDIIGAVPEMSVMWPCSVEKDPR